ncbi:MAG: J domain-containing protein [Massilia sp.]
MAKIHTHYDNLKVARLAPQEVIRAAYKALSQKYHPDKNPGDEKAARIMAIVNSAYGTLSDPERRREHDEWIAAEEWEIEWLESTRAEEGRDKVRLDNGQSWEELPVEAAAPHRLLRDPRWWCGLAGSFAVGCVAGLLYMGQAPVMPAALASAFKTAPSARLVEPVDVPRADKPAEPKEAPDNWAAEPKGVDGVLDQGRPDIKALAVTLMVIPARAPDCDSELHTLVAPNGAAWPVKSGYVDGYPVGNMGEDTRLELDNSANGSGVFVKVYDQERRSNVRHAYVLPHDSLLIDKLASGKYEVRYQNVEAGGSQADCQARVKGGKPAMPGL